MKHLVSASDLTRDEIAFLMELASRLKAHPEAYADRLEGRTLGLIFEKPSTRTWASFHAGMSELGGDSLYFGPQDIALGKREETRDVARVLSSYLAGFVLRTFAHRTITEFARYSGKPVINGLSDLSHPCQALTDLFTVREHWGAENLRKVKVAFVGDGNNVLHSLLLVFAKMGLAFSYATPKAHEPKASVVRKARELARRSKAKITASHTPREAVRGAQVVYTDVWVSMGEEKEGPVKKKAFRGFQVNRKLLRGAAREARVMHCLPAHRGEEISDEVMEGKHSLIFEQAANRLTVGKAILLYLMTSLGGELKR
jgi:ornithine carbamoyltransferase